MRWAVARSSDFSGGAALVARRSGSRLSATLSGTSLALVVSPGPDRGVVAISVDGQRLGLLDLYSPTRRAKVEVALPVALAPGEHTITVTVTRQRNRESSGRRAVIDAFKVASAP